MRRSFLLITLCILLVGAFSLRLCIGSKGIDWPDSSTILTIRLERAIGGLLVGAALALAGALLQTLLRNPLASPDLIGPASGAGFAVTLSTFLISSGSGILLTTAVHSAAAFLGAAAALILVYSLSQRRGHVNPADLILIGVVVNILFGAGTLLLMHLMPDRGISIARWTIGALSDDVPRIALLSASLLIPAVLAVATAAHRHLDAATLHDEDATGLGVPIRSLRISLFIGAGLLTAASVVIAGPVGFIGLIAPHITRSFAGPAHKTLLPASTVLGATLIVSADALARLLPTRSGPMPLGIITAVIGGITLVSMLRHRAFTHHE